MAPFTKRRATSAARAVLAARSRSVVSTNPIKGSEPSGRHTCAHALSTGCSHSERTRLLTSHKLLKESMASARSTAGEKKRCLERIPSSGSSRQATQETGAAAAWSALRDRKHAKCPSPGAREAGQEAHRGPEKGTSSRSALSLNFRLTGQAHKAKPRRRSLHEIERDSWLNKEVETFLGILGEVDVQRELDGAVRNEKVFQLVSGRMAIAGYEKNTEQCRR
ncbi:unnamed protein product [Boreogadus saida]